MICAACSNLAVQINTMPESTIKTDPKWGHRYHEFGWKTVRQLLDFDAYQKCDLCKAFVSVVTVARLNEYLIRTQETEEPIGVQPSHINNISVGDGPGNVIQWATFILGPEDSDQIMFPVWREHDSERMAETEPLFHSSKGVSWAKPVMDTNARGPGTVAQIKSWLWHCISDHRKCRLALSGEYFGVHPQTSSLDQSKLPSRILDVGFTGSPLVRLVETTTETPKASYVALSHCWGPPDKRPLKTTLATLEEHKYPGIPFAHLPQTFADAVWVTRELGIRYLWIDSLCIIQDSPSDWDAESQQMGSIYEGATLTLGAAYASNSSEGLFKGLQRPDPKKIVKIPVYNNMKHMEGHSDLAVQSYATCFLAEPDWPTDPSPWYDSPLSRRAWVMQEWSLSRRFLWSEEKSLHWRCREETKADPYVDVRPIEFDEYSLITSNWHHLMQNYSSMQLTFETDRLVALRGMVAALKTSYRKDREYHFGLWMDGHGTLSALFWELDDLHVDSPEVYSLEIPSWSWASVVGRKRFRTIHVIPSSDTNRYYYDDRGITAENNGTELHFCAPIGVVQLCLEENYADRCRRKSASRYRRMSIYTTTNLSPYEETRFGSLTLDYTIDISDCPPPSVFMRHVIPLVRDLGITRANDRNKDYMLVVEPVTKPDGSRAYRRVGMGLIDQRFGMFGGKWPCWEKILSEMKMEKIVLV